MLGDRRPFFLQLVQQNNCIVFSCQKLTGWNKIVELGTAIATQGLDYGSESRHNCVKGRTVDVKEGVKKTFKRQKKSTDKQHLSPIPNGSSEMYTMDVFAS